MTEGQRRNVSEAIYDVLVELHQAGKNINMLKNAYIKFMCWLYYKFERIVNHLGDEKLPKILYAGTIGKYELLLMNVLSLAGCDIVLLQYQGDKEYLKIDPDSVHSDEICISGMQPFPENFSLQQVKDNIQKQMSQERLYGTKPSLINCTNAWISGKILEDIQLNPTLRGNDPNLFYNCFFRIRGAEDRLTYENELYQLQMEIKNNGRKLVIINNAIKPPSMEEINLIQRKNYQSIEQLISHLSKNIQYTANQELQRIMIKAFVDLLLEEREKKDLNLHKVTNKAVYLLCWLRRYQQQLFKNWKSTDISCFFYMGGCKNDSDSLFCRFLARMPVDVVIFCPDLKEKCCLEDSLLYEKNYSESLSVEMYPESRNGNKVGTSAYHAEKDLDELIYKDTGLYRNQQYTKANTMLLQTMYEEIPILWNQDLKYRPNFSTADGLVNMPVIFAKVCGIKDGSLQEYWNSIKKLITSDTIVIKKVPQITSVSENPVKAYVPEFLKNGRIQREKIKKSKVYQYDFLRETMQDYILDKLQLLIEQRIIQGTFENGTEYTIVSVVLNLGKDILRMIQKFDFTKKNPKLIYIITGETVLSLEDTIYVNFLSLIGFDIVFFVPTGYQCIEKYFKKNIVEEHQIGEYFYDLQIPDFDTVSVNTNMRSSWRELFFKRGT